MRRGTAARPTGRSVGRPTAARWALSTSTAPAEAARPRRYRRRSYHHARAARLVRHPTASVRKGKCRPGVASASRTAAARQTGRSVSRHTAAGWALSTSMVPAEAARPRRYAATATTMHGRQGWYAAQLRVPAGNHLQRLAGPAHTRQQCVRVGRSHA